jgi:two-component system, chemotaxis family, protein-glutamate methylesterase/glutaminase
VVNHPTGVVVIGASAGGITSLLSIIERLPPSLMSPVLVVVHIGRGQSFLPKILSRVTSLTCRHAIDGEPIQSRHIYVAPPDYHLLVRGRELTLSHGPREHHTRPAIDPLFISAARAYGPAVIGIVLSGALSDGAAGLLAIKSAGGRAIVQDPNDAANAGMPRSALQFVEADAVLPAHRIAEEVVTMLESNRPIQPRVNIPTFDLEDVTTEIIQDDFREQASDQRAGELTPFTCPDCGGTLWQSELNGLLGFKCHVGHGWSWESLSDQKSEELEQALWASVRLLVERATLNRQISVHARNAGAPDRGEHFDEQAARDQAHAVLVRNLLESLSNSTTVVQEAEQAVSAE